MNDTEKKWILKCKTHPDKYRIMIDNDSIFIDDMEMDELKKWIGDEGMTEREREINTILTMVRAIMLEAKLTITTKEEVPLLVKDGITGEMYAFWKREAEITEKEDSGRKK